MEYCVKPHFINDKVLPTEYIKQALQRVRETTVENHSLYAECYIKQRGLIDAIRRRTVTPTSG